MPNIREFNTPALGLTPSSVGTEAAAGAARRIGGLYNQVGESLQTTGQRIGGAVRDAGDVAVKYAEHREISLGSKNLAELQANQVSAWNSASKNADPNDPTVAAKFNAETLEPALEQFSGSFMTEGGQRFAQESANRFRQHMFEKTAADMSSMAADAVHMNVIKTMNASGNMVYNDPSSLDFARDNLRASVSSMADSSPNLTPAQAAKVKNDLAMEGETHMVRAAIMGTIAKGGDWKHIADDPKNAPYVNQAEIETFAKAQKAQDRTDVLRQKQIDLYTKQQNVAGAEAALSKNWTDSVTFDQNGKATIKPDFFNRALDIERQFPGAATERTRAMINWGQAEQREKREVINTDPTVQKNLMDGLFSTDKPTTDTDILRAAADNKLDAHATSVLLQLHKSLEEAPLKGPIYHDTMEAVKGTLGTDPKGHEAYGKFVQQFIPEYLRQMKAGTVPPNALDTRDPNSLISQAMAPYKRDAKTMLIDRISHGLIAPGEALTAPPGAVEAATGVKPTVVRQGGHTYRLQPDDTYKAID